MCGVPQDCDLATSNLSRKTFGPSLKHRRRFDLETKALWILKACFRRKRVVSEHTFKQEFLACTPLKSRIRVWYSNPSKNYVCIFFRHWSRICWPEHNAHLNTTQMNDGVPAQKVCGVLQKVKQAFACLSLRRKINNDLPPPRKQEYGLFPDIAEGSACLNTTYGHRNTWHFLSFTWCKQSGWTSQYHLHERPRMS